MKLRTTEDKPTQSIVFLIRAEIRIRAKIIVTSLSRGIYSDRPKNNITIKFSNTCVILGFTVKINLFKYKRFKDGRCRYNNTGSRHLMTPLAEICHFINENI